MCKENDLQLKIRIKKLVTKYLFWMKKTLKRRRHESDRSNQRKQNKQLQEYYTTNIKPQRALY